MNRRDDSSLPMAELGHTPSALDELYAAALLERPEVAFELVPEAFVEAALAVLLDPSRRARHRQRLASRVGVRAPEPSPGLAERVRAEGLAALEPRELSLVFASSTSFAAVCEVLDEFSERSERTAASPLAEALPESERVPFHVEATAPVEALPLPLVVQPRRQVWKAAAILAAAIALFATTLLLWPERPDVEDSPVAARDAQKDEAPEALVAQNTAAPPVANAPHDPVSPAPSPAAQPTDPNAAPSPDPKPSPSPDPNATQPVADPLPADPAAAKTDEPKTDKPKTDTPTTDSKPDEPKTDKPKTDKPKTDKPKDDKPKDDKPKTDKPKDEPKESSGGALTKSEVTQVMRELGSRFATCRTSTAETVKLSFVIEGNGRVSQAKTDSPDAEEQRCLLEILDGARFRASGHSLPVTYPVR